MNIIIGIIITFFVCISILCLFNKKDTHQNSAIYKRSSFLYCASNKNSYTKARDVFETLDNAGIEPNFLGGQKVSTRLRSQDNASIEFETVRKMNKDISSFDHIWKKIVLPSITLCERELDNDFAKQSKISLEDLEIYKNKLEHIYKRKREWLKNEYLPNEEKPILDFHKLSSIMCRSIIGVKPFRYDIDTAEKSFAKTLKNKQLKQIEKVNWQIDNVYVNYKLAFFVAEGIVFVDLLFWAQEKINYIKKQYAVNDIDLNIDNVNSKLQVYTQLIDLLNTQQQRLYSYKTSETHDNFVISEIIALMKNDYLKRDFDYLQFALSMFQWQEYTKKQHIYEILNKNNFKLTLSDLV